MKQIMTFFLILACLSTLAADEQWQYSYYTTIDHTSFREYDIFHQSINFDDIDYPLLHAAIVFVTNEMRIQHGLTALPFAIELERAAFHHSKNMANRGFFSHTDPYNNNRSQTEDRARLAGITNPFIAENIAQSFAIQYQAGKSVHPIDSRRGTFSYEFDDPQIPPHTYLSFGEAIVKQWMNSPGHRANILSGKALSIGCGAFFYNDSSFYNMPKFMATQNFQWFREIIPGDPTDLAPGENGPTSDNSLQHSENEDDLTNPFY